MIIAYARNIQRGHWSSDIINDSADFVKPWLRRIPSSQLKEGKYFTLLVHINV